MLDQISPNQVAERDEASGKRKRREKEREQEWRARDKSEIENQLRSMLILFSIKACRPVFHSLILGSTALTVPPTGQKVFKYRSYCRHHIEAEQEI